MKFNLVTDPWIPVLIGSQRHILGLAEIFSKSEKISSVANDPAERFAIMRLLLCITQAALDGCMLTKQTGSAARMKSFTRFSRI